MCKQNCKNSCATGLASYARPGVRCGMDKETAIKKAGSVRKLAAMFGIKHQAVYAWRTIPQLRVYQLRQMKPHWFRVTR